MTGGASFRKPAEQLAALTGQRLAGGCDDCNAEQVLAEHAPGVFVLEIRHDPTCPTYQRIVARRDGGSR